VPVTPTYPGIYIQEAPSNNHTITAAPTNIAVFIGYTHPLLTPQSNTGQPVQLFSFADYITNFGGFVRSAAFANAWGTATVANTSPPVHNPGAFIDLAQAVNQFFLNAGPGATVTAYVVSVNNTNNGVIPNLTPVSVWLSGGTLTSGSSQSPPPPDAVVFTAKQVTDEVYTMAISIRPVPVPTSSPPADPLADIIITYGPAATPAASPRSSPPASPVAAGPGTVVETYRRVSLNQYQVGPNNLPDPNIPNPNYIVTRLGASTLVTVPPLTAPGSWPPGPGTQQAIFDHYLPQNTVIYNPNDYTAVLQEDTDLDKLQVFNLMIIPGVADASLTWPGAAGDASGALIIGAAVAFCERRMAFLILAPPVADTADGNVPPLPGTVPPGAALPPNTIQNTMSQGLLGNSKNSAVYFPYLLTPNPITGSPNNPVTGRPNEIPPSGTVAGLYAATDLARGVWKAPAGFQTVCNSTITGVVARGVMTDQRQGTLNPLGVNCMRQFPNINTVVFGARTLATQTDQQWRYVSVRRMALFIEQTLSANLKWVVFEPNAPPLWSAISMSINAFMLGLYNQGAFFGTSPSQAFLVQCDSTTTTATDIQNGIVNIVVGFAPLSPAEFVIITLAQLALPTSS
jgi:uncharacterized protein